MRRISMANKNEFFPLAVQVANEAIGILNDTDSNPAMAHSDMVIARAQVLATLALTLAALDISMEIGIRE